MFKVGELRCRENGETMKFLEILNSPHHISKFNNVTMYVYKKYQIDDVLVELKESLQPKSCLNCEDCSADYQLLSNPPQYELKCGIFKNARYVDLRG